jgi:DNA-binding response OmpR family regulator
MPSPESQIYTALVLDDDPGMLALLKALLQDAGFATTCLTHGQAALAALREHSFDVLMIDQWLQGMSGLQVCAAARSYHGNRPAILIVSADARVERQVLALQLGADDFISKPFNIVELMTRVETCLRRRPAA